MTTTSLRADKQSHPESPYAWGRLVAALLLTTIGGSGMYGVTVALPAVQAEFGSSRSDASLPYTLTMVGFALGGILMGKLSDRFGVIVPVLAGAAALGIGFQLRDDILGIWGEGTVTGKPVGADIAKHAVTVSTSLVMKLTQ